ERVVFPEACVLTDHLIRLTARIVRELRFHPDNIRRNLELPMGLNMAEPVMMELAKRGVGRQEAHAIVRECAMIAFEGRRHMKDVLLENSAVSKYMKREEIEDIMEPGNYTGTAVEQVEALITKLRGRFIRAARD
ncbi:MAG TPA: adenylosuccinate lyase, partial [Candidatus Methanoperedenaceae archaeon]|nr:adenylosuccinate lyase [Candidatus Methanoperedenaceae archaeon]